LSLKFDFNVILHQDKWLAMTADGGCPDEAEVFRLTYYGGVAASIRKQVWPYLLGHVPFASSEQERKEQDCSVRRAYETTMSEWLAVEAIVRQRDKETMAANLAKLSSESTSNAGDAPPQVNQDLTNDVSFNLFLLTKGGFQILNLSGAFFRRPFL